MRCVMTMMIGAMTNQGGGVRGRAGQRESQRDERACFFWLRKSQSWRLMRLIAMRVTDGKWDVCERDAEKSFTFKRDSVVTKSVPSFGRCVKVGGRTRGCKSTRGRAPGDSTKDE